MGPEEELDLTLSLRCGGSKETPLSSPSPSLPVLKFFQTNLPLMQTFCPNPNPNPNLNHVPNVNPNPSLATFSNHNNNCLSMQSTNPPNAPVVVPKNVSTDTNSLGRSRRTVCIRRGKGMKETVRGKAKNETIPALFPWMKNQRASVHSKQYLSENNIHTIKGKVHCKRCDHEFELSLDLEEKLKDLCQFISRGKNKWHNRAPRVWMNPVFPKCPLCGRDSSTRPIIAKNKKEINWLFLLLGQMLGCCTLNHLKYFCKHNEIHRTGAKDRLLYDIYENLINQLVPGFLSKS